MGTIWKQVPGGEDPDELSVYRGISEDYVLPKRGAITYRIS